MTLGGALDLAFANGFEPTGGDTFTLIDNATGSAVKGSFANVSPTGYFKSGGLLWELSTTGGDNGESVTATAFQTSFTGVASAAQLSATSRR